MQMSVRIVARHADRENFADFRIFDMPPLNQLSPHAFWFADPRHNRIGQCKCVIS